MKTLERYLWLALLLPLLIAVSDHARAASQPVELPNIVIIHADDLGWSDTGCYGNDFIETPAIDELARQGLRFTQAYAGGPICTPARAALITGLHPARLHITGQSGYRQDDQTGRKFAHPEFQTALPPNAPTIAKTLKLAGYTSYCVGKWGLDNPPQAFGFNGKDASDEASLTRQAVAVIRQNADRRFFLYFNPHRPHVPLHPPAELLAKYEAKANGHSQGSSPAYAAEVEALDQSVAAVLAELDRLNLTGRTLVVFASDNGGFLGTDEDRITTNAPLREGKASLYEGGIRVPLIVRWPGVTSAGATCDFPIHWIDWHPTLAEVAGIAPAKLPQLDGRSFLPLLQGAATLPMRPLFWHYPHYRRAMAGLAASPSSAIRLGDWKLIHFYETDQAELYNLRDDEGETHDLASSNPAKTAELLGLLDAWRKAVDAQPPAPNPSP